MSHDIQISRLKQFPCYEGRLIRVSNNVRDMAPQLDLACLNLLMAIVCSLQRAVTQSADADFEAYREVKVEIPRHYVSLHHSTDIVHSLMCLYDFSFIFQNAIPGYGGKGITRLISGIQYMAGHVIVTIPGDTIPWLIYAGPTVNYLQIEEAVFFQLKTRTEKLLYIILLSKTDYRHHKSYVSIQVQDLYSFLTMKQSMSISYFRQKYLDKFILHLKETRSKFGVQYTLKSHDGFMGRMGRRPVSRVDFVITNNRVGDVEDIDPVAVLAHRLTQLMTKYGPKKSVDLVWLVQQIEQSEHVDELLAKMQRISKKYEDNKDKLAYTAAKVLREDYGICI